MTPKPKTHPIKDRLAAIKDNERKYLLRPGDPMEVEQLVFTPLPTHSFFTEYYYDDLLQEMKIHIWARENIRRQLWRELLGAFDEGVDWIPWVEKRIGNYICNGSFFVGVVINKDDVHSLFGFLLELDHKMTTILVL